MKKYLAIVAALALVTLLLAMVHGHTRPDVPAGSLVFEAQGVSRVLDPGALPLEPVKGTLVNGKGEERPVDGEGIALRDLLAREEVGAFERVTVTADDEYSAVLTREEIEAEGRVWLLRAEGGPQLVVFGDPDAKRAVKRVARLRVEGP